MKKYEIIIDYIEKIESWKSEEAFLINAIILSISKTFKTCLKELENDNIITALPLLRTIQEGIIALLGLLEETYTVKDYIFKEFSPKAVMEQIKTKEEEINNNEDLINFEMLNQYLFYIKKHLNDYSHTNFKTVMMHFNEQYQESNTKLFNRTSSELFIVLLELPFLSIINELFDLNIVLPNKNELKGKLKKIKTLKYSIEKFPSSVKSFIKSSPHIKEYYDKEFAELEKKLKKIKSIEELNKQ